jgi:hypothetical protein
LVFACIYNATSQGKGSLERGLLTDAMNRVCKQHHEVFGVNVKRIKRTWLTQIIKSLVEKDFLVKVGNVQELFMGKTVTRPNYEVTSNALTTLKRLNLQQGGESSPNALF